MFAYDEEVWRTINGAKVELESTTGEIKKGMGGKYIGRKVSRLSKAKMKQDDNPKSAVNRVKTQTGKPKSHTALSKATGKGKVSTIRATRKPEPPKPSASQAQTKQWPEARKRQAYPTLRPYSLMNAKEKAKWEERSGGKYAAMINTGQGISSNFASQKLSANERHGLERSASNGEVAQIKETEKAVKIRFEVLTPDGKDWKDTEIWVPKSVVGKEWTRGEEVAKRTQAMQRSNRLPNPERIARTEKALRTRQERFYRATGQGEKADNLANARKARGNNSIAFKVQSKIDKAYKWADEEGNKRMYAKEWTSPDGTKSRTYLTAYRTDKKWEPGGGNRGEDLGYIDNLTGEYHGRLSLDSRRLALDASPSVRYIDDNGYLHVAITPISKACVNPYLGRELPDWEKLKLDPDRIYYGFRDPDELSKAVNTFNGLPVLFDHHETDAENPAKEYTIGSTGTTATFEAPYLKNGLTITDAEAIKAIEDGSAKELSCAYRFTPDFTPGEWEAPDGQKIHYDFVIKDIKGNHVALVAEGRAGHDVAVADSNINIIRRSDNRMKGWKKTVAFKRRRNALVQDANLGIEAAEVMSAGFQKAINVIEAQVEGYAPRDVGLDIDETATVDEIIAKYMPGLDTESKALYAAVLSKLKGAPAQDEDIEEDDDLTVTETVEEDDCMSEDEDIEEDDDLNFAEGVKYGEELEKNPAERRKLDREHESEGMKKALGEDDDLSERMKDPVFRHAFEMGVKYGEAREKANPKRIDRDHEREGMERALGEDSIAKIKRQIMADTKAKVNAVRKCRPLIGDADPMAFDSAADVYAFALRQNGQNPENYPAAAYAGMVDVALANRPRYPMAADSAFRVSSLNDDEIKAFERLRKIQ